MLENILLSLQSIWSHKMRSFLTMLGIIIGIASIISIVSTIQGTNEQIKKDLIGAGNNTVKVEIYQGDQTYEMYDYSPIPDGMPVISEEVRKEIEALPEAEEVALYITRNYVEGIFYNDISLEGANVYGIDNHYFNVNDYIIRSGRRFLEEDFTNFHKVAILDQTASDSLFQQESPIGKTLEISGHPFTIIGVVQKSEEYQPTINSIDDYYTYLGNAASGIVYIPSAAWGIPYQYDVPQNVVIKARTTDDMSAIGKKCAEILNESVNTTNKDIKYKYANMLESDAARQKLSESTNTQLLWIASISLLVGGIGVMNIMLVSVTERTSEVGLKKAVGAKRKSILIQFLTEAAVLTSLGGIIGVIGGIGLAEAISRVAEIPVAINVPAIIISVVFSMLIGVIFGLLPSIKAANLNPIDALRHE